MSSNRFFHSVFVATLVGLIAGCSDSTADGRSTANGGNGAGANAGSTGGGMSGLGTVPNAGSGAGVALPMNGGGGSGGTAICNELKIETKPVVPSVVILVDNSSSMFEPRAELWDRLYSVLMDPAGPVKTLESKVRFGFANYRGSATPSTEASTTCADMTTVPIQLDNFDEINTVYTRLGTEWTGQKWETPTGHAVRRVTAELAAYMPDPPGPKYILLVTDGNPNTCQTLDPQCGQDLSIKAVQDATAQGIGTFVVGIGDIIGASTGCNMVQSRCGALHLQDIANAGLGLPVAAPPTEFIYQPCVSAMGGTLTAAYAPAGTAPGMAEYFTATSREQLTTAVQGLLNNVVSCTVEMNAIVQGDASLGMVDVGTQRVTFNDPNGWRLEADNFSVTLQGAACTTFKAGADLHIAFPCPPPGQPPIVIPR